MTTLRLSDYSLTGQESEWAVERGLASATWYTSPVPRETMRELLTRRNGPAIRDTLLWFGLLIAAGIVGAQLWGTAWAIIPFAIYGVIYASSSDSRWHESSHGTAFKTDWMNNILFEISSFMVLRESAVSRWSHTRHHSDTIIVGRDPEIAVPRPPDMKNFALAFSGIIGVRLYFKKILLHCVGRLDPQEATYIPETEQKKIFVTARIHLLIYAGVIGSCLYFSSILPLMFIGLPNIYGAWLAPIYGFTQHAGLAENVLDHRMNCRTVTMNFINRYLYWNMNYHVEHHMFPLVPYHNLPRLHEIVKPDMPTPYKSLLDAWREVIPTVLRQVKDPGYFVKRELPTPTVPSVANVAAKTIVSSDVVDADGWIEVSPADALDREDVLRFDCAEHTYAVYRTTEGGYYATDGICTHGNTHLATGLVKGHLIECPKHNGRFDLRDGSPKRPPVCVGLKTYPVKQESGCLFINVAHAGGQGAVLAETTYSFRVVRNENVATYIKELVMELTEDSPKLSYKPGQHIQMNIPAYGDIPFSSFDVKAPYDQVWRAQHVYDYKAENHTEVRRNFSLAGNPETDGQMRFNVRIAAPPRGQDCNAGVGSSYVWNLKSGETVTAIGPYGDFLVKETDKEMVYLGGGSGMAPLRSHLSTLFETRKTQRKVSYWYGARSRQELFYQDYFEALARQFENFSFHLALSEPMPEDNWTSYTGLIHEVLKLEYLDGHFDPTSIEYYCCGPQPMIQAARQMLKELGVGPDQVAYDEF
jgi:Na(+)-translocating NADH:ubiquinone oxidoreductase F subunit